jgi:hypothetical protein
MRALRQSIAAAVIVGIVVIGSSCMGATLWDYQATDDLFDTSQGAIVTSHSALSGIPPHNDMSDAIGAGPPTGVVKEPTHYVHFGDFSPAGFAHYFEFQTAAPVTVKAIGLLAAHDNALLGAHNPPRDRDARGFTSFRLYADGDLVFEYFTSNPYGTSTAPSQGVLLPVELDTHLALRANLSAPVTAQNWRAEFVQASDRFAGHASGPRVLEVDGFGYLIPEPATGMSAAIAMLVLLSRIRAR